MTSEREQFEKDAKALQITHDLADHAEQMAGDDAAPLLVGAALQVWKRRYGDEHALNLAKIALSNVVRGLEEPTESN